MTRFEQFLADRMRDVIARKRVLVVFDPETRLLAAIRSLASEYCRVIEVGDDVIAAREEALEELGDVGRDPSSSKQLVVYLQRSKPLDDESVIMNPFTPLLLAGAVFPDGAGES